MRRLLPCQAQSGNTLEMMFIKTSSSPKSVNRVDPARKEISSTYIYMASSPANDEAVGTSDTS